MEKKPETQKDNEGEGSNSHEVFRTYLMTIVATLLIIILSIVTYYYPMYFTSQKALDIIRKQKLPILANLTIFDAKNYGQYLQSKANLDGGHIFWYIIWMSATCGLIIYSAIKSERFYCSQFDKKCLYQDLTLEFINLKKSIVTELEILKIFSFLSSENVKEISLVYDLDDFMKYKASLEMITKKIEASPRDESLILKKEMMEDKLNVFKDHFSRYKKGYFQNRGFVTFKTYKMAHEVKEVFKRAFSSRKDDLLDIIISKAQILLSKLQKPKQEERLRGKALWRAIVFNKIIKKKTDSTSSSAGFLAMAANLLNPAMDSNLKRKVEFMKETVGQDFELRRGIPAEDINWEYRPEKQIQESTLIGFGVLVFIILPMIEYVLSFYYYFYTFEKFQGTKQSLVMEAMLILSLVLMVAVDKIAIFCINRVFDKSKFLKVHEMIGFKFYSTNLYVLLSNLFALNYGLVQAGNLRMVGVTKDEDKYSAVKQLIDSFYFTYYILVLSNLYTYLIQPVITYKRTGEPTVRDITFGLSFLSTCVFYIGSFAPFNSSIIIIVTFAVMVFVIGEFILYHKGIIIPPEISLSIIANYHSMIFVGILPISLGTFWMLGGNKMELATVRLFGSGIVFGIIAIFLLVLYFGAAFLFSLFFSEERYLKRVQSGIWYLHRYSTSQEPKGHSYMLLNPVYSDFN